MSNIMRQQFRRKIRYRYGSVDYMCFLRRITDSSRHYSLLQTISAAIPTSTSSTSLVVDAVLYLPQQLSSSSSSSSWNTTALLAATASMMMITLTNTTSHCNTRNTSSSNHRPTTNLNCCQCHSYTDNNNNDDDDDDPTDHNFDGEEHVEYTNTTTSTASKDNNAHTNPHVTNMANPFGNGKPIKELIDTLSNSISSVVSGASSSGSTDDENTNDENDWIETVVSNTISSSINSENVAAQTMKEWMEQMMKIRTPNDHHGADATTTTTGTNQQSQSDNNSLQQILQCLLNIVMDTNTNVTTTPPTTTVPGSKENSSNSSRPMMTMTDTTNNIKQAVVDLLATIQQQNQHQPPPQQPSKHLTGSNDKTNETTVTTTTTTTTMRDRYQQIDDTSSIFDLYTLLNTYSDDIQQMVTKHMSTIDYQRITPTAILYYADYANQQYESIIQERLRQSTGTSTTDSYHHINSDHTVTNETMTTTNNAIITTTASSSAIDPSILQLIERHPDAIDFARLAYADTVEEIQCGIQNLPSKQQYQYELIHCNLQSEPGKPAHFCTIRTEQQPTTSSTRIFDRTDNDTTLHVVLVIRGTKTVADAITDLLCDTQPYHRWGQAHSYILDSGRYIANLYRTVFYDLLSNNNNNHKNTNGQTISKINVTIYGHSLGAGAGAIAAMELHNLHDRRIQVQMIGYGCPAIVSKNLGEQTSDYITTFINDSDLVPRLSGISLTNLLYDIIEFDWMPYAQKDLRNIFNDLQQRQPILFNTDTVTTMANLINPILESIYHDTYVPSGTIPHIQAELYPPGKCIHIYRDGHDHDHRHHQHRSACYVPNGFYSKIDPNEHMIDDHLLSSGYIKAIAELQRAGDQKN